jgi:hypothetical protein
MGVATTIRRLAMLSARHYPYYRVTRWNEAAQLKLRLLLYESDPESHLLSIEEIEARIVSLVPETHLTDWTLFHRRLVVLALYCGYDDGIFLSSADIALKLKIIKETASMDVRKILTKIINQKKFKPFAPGSYPASIERWIHSATEHRLEELNINRRTYNCLKRFGKVTVREVMAMEDAEYLAMPHFGVRSLEQLKKCLEDWKAENPDWETYPP